MSVTTKTINWPGASGKTYQYFIYEVGDNLKDAGGNYIFAKLNSQGRWTPVYIGQTSTLAERFDNHHKASCIRINGATHIHAHLNASEADRFAEETDLLRNFSPPCNG